MLDNDGPSAMARSAESKKHVTKIRSLGNAVGRFRLGQGDNRGSLHQVHMFEMPPVMPSFATMLLMLFGLLLLGGF